MLKSIVTLKKEVSKQLENYDKPTPKKWKKVGKAIFGLGTVITIITSVVAAPWIPIVAAAVTWIGTTITDFATE